MIDKNKVKQLKEKAKELIGEIGTISEDMNEISEWNSTEEIVRNITTVYKYISKVVLCIDEAAKDIAAQYNEIQGMTSEEKLEAATAIVDEMIELPFYLEFFDGPAIRILISMVVTFLNEKYGDNWNSKEIKGEA